MLRLRGFIITVLRDLILCVACHNRYRMYYFRAGVGKLFVLLGQIFIYPVACGPQYFPPINAIDFTIMRRVSVYCQAHIKTQYIDLFTIINVKDDVVSV